jgi:hypothetical protein
MITKNLDKILFSDDFKKMPIEVQATYMCLALLAEDDGFVDRPKLIKSNIPEKTLNVLLESKYAVRYEDGILLINNWIIHEYLKAQENER